MGIVDVIILVIFIFGAYLGYQSGVIKQLNDLAVLFLSSLLAGVISDLLFGLLYKVFPFFNFSGKTEGLKSINIILWKLILFVLLIVIIIFIVKKLYIKLKIEDKLTNSILEANLISKILGVILSIPLMLVLVFDVILILLLPNLNLESVNNSKLAGIIIKNTPILSKQNGNLYENQKYIIERINKDDNTLENYEQVNDDIVQNMLTTNLVSEDKINFLEKKNKLLGKRDDDPQEKQEDTTEDDGEDESSSDQEEYSEDGYYEDEYSDESEEYYDEGEYYEDEFIDDEFIDDDF